MRQHRLDAFVLPATGFTTVPAGTFCLFTEITNRALITSRVHSAIAGYPIVTGQEFLFKDRETLLTVIQYLSVSIRTT